MGNRRVRVIWSDLNGLSHGRYIPEHRFAEHGHHAVTTLTMGIDREILPVDGYAADVGFPDLSTRALAETRRPGWEPDTDMAIAELSYGGGPLPICPRNALVRAVEAWHALGYEPKLAYELEFFVLQADESSPSGWGPLDLPGHRVYGTGLTGDHAGLQLDFFDAAEHCELELEGVMAEFSPGQMELNLRYGDALDAADRAFVAKEMTRELAARKGAHVTYMGRPVAHFVGSGLHVNFSLSHRGDGSNAFADPSGEHGLSKLARSCIGGLLAHHEASTSFMAPLPNSYKRLQPGLIAGYWCNWGLDNRISTYRVPGERGDGTRIENRMPCGSASPYLAGAVTLWAALLGHEAGLDCGAPQMGDGDAEPNTDRHTPATLGDALDALEADTELAGRLGDDLVRAHLALRRYDLARFEAGTGAWDPETVSDWELSEYLPFY
jgi:glutamine synthetase